ncbi:cupin domain-containing protein [Actinomadura napierensis]|uniref:Cupin domain-containing protein n=1 Tax=Actinomadura napierensis TaxID=267854 RepID=A0ABN2XY51_9ACTN
MVRRVVTAVSGTGRSVISNDGELRQVPYRHTPGFAHSLVWTTGAPPVPRADGPGEPPASFVPGPGETIAMTVTFPPDSVFGDPAFDPVAAAAENVKHNPGLADLFEPDAPGMHTTPTVDYVVVLDGTVVLELDDGATTTLHPGDLVIQNATRHAWRVPSDRPATIFVVLMGHAR